MVAAHTPAKVAAEKEYYDGQNPFDSSCWLFETKVVSPIL